MVVAQISLPLGCHSPLCLHHLFRLVGTARGLVSLGGVEVLQAGAVAAAGAATDPRITKLRAWTRGSSAVCIPG